MSAAGEELEVLVLIGCLTCPWVCLEDEDEEDEDEELEEKKRRRRRRS